MPRPEGNRETCCCQQVDEELVRITATIRPIHYLHPVNADEQKQVFFSGETAEPKFVYCPLAYNPEEIFDRIDRLGIPEGRLSSLYQATRERLRIAHAINLRRGDAEFVQAATMAEFGRPTAITLAKAIEMLAVLPVEKPARNVTSEAVKAELESALAENGLEYWRVEYSASPQTTVYGVERRITVCEHRLFAVGDPQRLAVHEVGVHVLRAANGEQQSSCLFFMGLPGYLATEEGLAAYAEEVSSCSDAATMRNYAGRVLAVDAVHRGLTFRKTFERLRDHNFNANDAWDLCLRVFRGGGYLKDHVYLEGYLDVRAYAEAGNDLTLLFVGKVGLGDLVKINEWLSMGLLQPPSRLPGWLG